MFLPTFLSLVLSTFLTSSNAASNCPLYGRIFPKPQRSSSSTAVQAALQSVTAAFASIDAQYGANNSFSIQVFTSDEILYQHYHTAPTLPSLAQYGVKQVDENTVYRIGSITKIFTMYAFLLDAGQQYFGHAITEFVPELAVEAENKAGNAITTIDWADITIGDLASHLAGLTSDAYVGDVALTEGLGALAEGFPMIPSSEVPDCGFYPQCTRAQFFTNFAKYYPAEAIAETPVYSNVAFQILSYAMETITGKNFTDSLIESVVDPLGLTRTFYNTPDTSIGVIPGNLAATEWAYDLGLEGPAGIIYSSAKDLATLGQSILKNQLLSPLQTRRWLKPTTLTSDPRETVGYPWGIRQITLNESEPYQIITSYNKGGSIGTYASDLSLIPELDVGFSILIAGGGGVSSLGLATVIGTYLLPALQETARSQAAATYTGTYTSGFLGLDQITITTDPYKPGLGVSNWYNNGHNMLNTAYEIIAATSGSSPTFEARLYPTDLTAVDENGNNLVAFKAVFEDLAYQGPDNMFESACGTWIGPGGIVYGSQQFDEFIFTTGLNGEVLSVLNSALRVTLNKS